MEKLQSRKFWVAVLTAVLLVAKDGLGIDVDIDAVTTATVAVVTAAYLIGQGIVMPSAGRNKPWLRLRRLQGKTPGFGPGFFVLPMW